MTLIEPGDFRTHATKNRVFSSKPAAESAYADAAGRAFGHHGKGLAKRPAVGKTDSFGGKNHPSSKTQGQVQLGLMDQRFSLIAKRLLPAGLFEKMLMNYYKLS